MAIPRGANPSLDANFFRPVIQISRATPHLSHWIVLIFKREVEKTVPSKSFIIIMVSIHRKKSFKTTVSFVSTNVFQKVVTIRNSCSRTTASPPPEGPTAEVGVRREIMDEFCCSISVPMNIIACEQDEVSEVSLDVHLVIGEVPPPPPPPSWRNFCMPPKSRITFGLHHAVDSMEWPSDEDDDFEKTEEEEDTNTLWEPTNQTCGCDFWPPRQQTTSEAWGLSIANRDDEEEDGRLSSSNREHDLTSSGFLYETKEPIGIFRQSIFTFQGLI